MPITKTPKQLTAIANKAIATAAAAVAAAPPRPRISAQMTPANFMAYLTQNKMIVPGTTIPRAKALSILGVTNIPKLLTHQECADIKVLLISPIGYVRDKLLPRGIYFGQVNGDFVFYNQYDNIIPVDKYVHKLRNAAKRCLLLNDNTPTNMMPLQAKRAKALNKVINAVANI